MRKLFYLLLFLPFSVFSQNNLVDFEWQPNGQMTTRNGETHQIVLFDNKSCEVIYQELLTTISSIYNNPQQTISTVENKLISINAIQPTKWHVGGLLGVVEVNIHYVLKIHIKDNRIKIDAPYFTLLTFSTGGSQDDIEGWTKAQKFFNSDGSIKEKKGRKQFYIDINSNFNNLIKSILNYNIIEEDW